MLSVQIVIPLALSSLDFDVDGLLAQTPSSAPAVEGTVCCQICWIFMRFLKWKLLIEFLGLCHLPQVYHLLWVLLDHFARHQLHKVFMIEFLAMHLSEHVLKAIGVLQERYRVSLHTY